MKKIVLFLVLSVFTNAWAFDSNEFDVQKGQPYDSYDINTSRPSMIVSFSKEVITDMCNNAYLDASLIVDDENQVAVARIYISRSKMLCKIPGTRKVLVTSRDLPLPIANGSMTLLVPEGFVVSIKPQS